MEKIKNTTLVRIDKNGIERTKKGLQDKTELLNKFIDVTEKTLKTTLSDKEKIDLKDNGLTFVNEWIKPKFKFPDADYSFNLQALGMDLTPISNYWNANKNRWKSIQVVLDKGKFVIPDIDSLPEVTRHYYYAKNEAQEKAFQEATEICKALNKFQGKGFIKHNKWQVLADTFEFVRFGTESGENIINAERKFYPKEWAILKI